MLAKCIKRLIVYSAANRIMFVVFRDSPCKGHSVCFEAILTFGQLKRNSTSVFALLRIILWNADFHYNFLGKRKGCNDM